MRPFERIAAIGVLLLSAACNFPMAQATYVPSANEQAATSVAATLAAQPTATVSEVTPFASPSAPTVTPTTKPTFSVTTDNAECRNAPAAGAKTITRFPAGTVVDLVGKDTADSYYIVIDPASHDLCWIEAQNGTPGGSFSLLPEMTPQAQTTAQAAKVPAKPGALFYTFTCLGGGQVTVDLKWSDVANNETGYHVYRDGTQIANLPANSTTYTDTAAISPGIVIHYAVEAYNDAGASPQSVTGNGDPISC